MRLFSPSTSSAPSRLMQSQGAFSRHPGRSHTWRNGRKSKGCLIIALAALELSGDCRITPLLQHQEEHDRDDPNGEFALDRYRDRRKLYLSWDAASWHISKRLSERIEENNKAATESGGPIVDTAPLPARAQFLNVIESIFSGMARAIIHNSNYQSVAEAKAAIDRYFDERNRHFLGTPAPRWQQDLGQGAGTA